MDKEQAKEKIGKLDKSIDEKVFELYGVKEEDIKIIKKYV